MVNKKNKFGWTLMELMLAMMVLSILVGLSVQIVKNRKIQIKPFTYTAIANLQKGNSYVMEKLGEQQLPDLPVPDAPGDDPYCAGIGDAFNTLGAINCKVTCTIAGGVTTCVPDFANRINFEAVNKVSYSGMNGAWAVNAQNQSVKTIIIDTNGGKNGNYPLCPQFRHKGGNSTAIGNNIHIGRECFQLNVYRFGTVTPTGKCLDEANTLVECIDTNYPFGYDVWEAHAPSAEEITAGKCRAGDDDCRVSTKILSNISYSEAYCRSESSTSDARTIPVADCTTKGYSIHASCDTDPSPYANQFCILRSTKPSLMMFR